MTTKHLLSPFLIGVVAVTTIRTIAEEPVAKPITASQQEQSFTPQEVEKQVEALPKQRRDTLKKMVGTLEAAAQSGQVNSRLTILRAKRELLDAEIELAKSRAERVALRKQIVANLKEVEETAESRFRLGMNSAETLLRAKAARLKAEVELLREKAEKAL